MAITPVSQLTKAEDYFLNVLRPNKEAFFGGVSTWVILP